MEIAIVTAATRGNLRLGGNEFAGSWIFFSDANPLLPCLFLRGVPVCGYLIDVGSALYVLLYPKHRINYNYVSAKSQVKDFTDEQESLGFI